MATAMADNEGGGEYTNRGCVPASLKALFFLPWSSRGQEDPKPADVDAADIEEGGGGGDSDEGNGNDHPDDCLPTPRQPQPQLWGNPVAITGALGRIALVLLGSLSILLVLLWQLGYLPSSPSSPPAPERPPPRPRVDLNYTIYEGERLPNGINRFLGMRYAAPPLGDLRFRAPVELQPEPASPRSVVKQATRFRPICLATGRRYPYGDQDEDCLFVNVWAPADAIPGRSKLPVWVFISGGGYNSLSNANWNGEGVVEKSGNKIILVNFNYRVGMWGFLASERVRRDGDLNVGLLDQRMLFKWVKKHIALFGGDPDHVVIHGASAGAGSVAMHMIAYGGRDDKLFAGVMSESVFFPAQPQVSEVEYQFDRVLSYTGCDGAPRDEQVSCLRGQDLMLLQAANHAQPFPGRPGPPNPLFYWTPCIDWDLLEDLPYRMFEDGRYIDVPLLAGTTTDEGSVFAPNAASEDDVANFFANNYPNLTPRETDLILRQYPKLAAPARPRHAEWYPAASQAYGEATFICPNVNIMNVLAGAAQTTTLTDKKRTKTGERMIIPNDHSQQQVLLQQLPSKKEDDDENNSNNTRVSASSLTTANRRRRRHPLFAYRYNVQDDDNLAWGLGVPHIFDSPAIFGPGNCPTARSYWTYNAPIVPVFMAYHISFVRSLDPNTYREPGSPVWESWGGERNSRDDPVVAGAGAGARAPTTSGNHDDDNDDNDDGSGHLGKLESGGDGEEKVDQRKLPAMRRLVVETGNTRMEDVSEAELRRCEFWLGLADVLEQM